MANDFYNFTPEFVPGTRVRSGDANIQFSAIEDAFDLIDASNPLTPRGTNSFTTETGTTNGYVVAMPTTRTTETDGDEVIFVATHTNTAAATLEVDGLGAKDIVRIDGSPVEANDIVDGLIYAFRYDATNTRYQLMASSLSQFSQIDVTGTPVNNEVALWSNATTLKSAARLKSSPTQFTAGNYIFDSDQTVGAAQDNYVLSYSKGSGEITLRSPIGGSASTTRHVFVTDFGATGDGTTDDTAAIQAAIDSLGADGGYVCFLPGTYLVGADGMTGGSLAGLDMFCIELKDNITLIGVGPASVIKLAAQAGGAGPSYPIAYIVWAGTWTPTATTGIGADKTVQRANIAIRELKLDCDLDNQPSGGTHDIANIRIGECSNIRVQNCELVGGVAETCYLLGKHDDYDQTAFIFTNNYVHDTGEWGVDSLGVHMDRINGAVVADNIIYDVGLRGIGCGRCSDVTIAGNWLGRNYDAGVRIAGGDNIVVVGNRMKDCNKYGIDVYPESSDDCFDIDIHNNQIECNAINGEAGIICTNASRVNITGNSITTIQWDGGAAGDLIAGIFVVSQSSVSVKDITINDNIIRNIDSNYTSGLTIAPTGIYVKGESASNYIENLQCSHNTLDDVFDGINISFVDNMVVFGNVVDGATNNATTFASNINVQTLSDDTFHQFGSFKFNTDQTVGASQDDYLLAYVDASGEIELEKNYVSYTAPTDTYYDDVTEVSNFEGTDGDTSFVSNFTTWTYYGNSEISSDQYVSTPTSSYFPRTGPDDYAEAASNAPFLPGGSDFTIEFYIYPLKNDYQDIIMGVVGSAGGTTVRG